MKARIFLPGYIGTKEGFFDTESLVIKRNTAIGLFVVIYFLFSGLHLVRFV